MYMAGYSSSSVLSTNTDPGKTVDVNRKKKDGSVISIPCPSAIADYNKYMGGIDHNDQLCQYYHVRPSIY